MSEQEEGLQNNLLGVQDKASTLGEGFLNQPTEVGQVAARLCRVCRDVNGQFIATAGSVGPTSSFAPIGSNNSFCVEFANGPTLFETQNLKSVVNGLEGVFLEKGMDSRTNIFLKEDVTKGFGLAPGSSKSGGLDHQVGEG